MNFRTHVQSTSFQFFLLFDQLFFYYSWFIRYSEITYDIFKIKITTTFSLCLQQELITLFVRVMMWKLILILLVSMTIIQIYIISCRCSHHHINSNKFLTFLQLSLSFKSKFILFLCERIRYFRSLFCFNFVILSRSEPKHPLLTLRLHVIYSWNFTTDESPSLYTWRLFQDFEKSHSSHSYLNYLFKVDVAHFFNTQTLLHTLMIFEI